MAKAKIRGIPLEPADFVRLTKEVYDRIFDAFEDYDPDLVEAFESSDNVRITFSSGTVFVINRQRPLSQLWLATKKQGLHFNYDPDQDLWVADKTGEEFFKVLAREITQTLGQPFNFWWRPRGEVVLAESAIRS